jgi:hypothetical protein
MRLKQRGLPGAVGPDQGDHFTRGHVEADVVDGNDATEGPAQVPDGEQRSSLRS